MPSRRPRWTTCSQRRAVWLGGPLHLCRRSAASRLNSGYSGSTCSPSNSEVNGLPEVSRSVTSLTLDLVADHVAKGPNLEAANVSAGAEAATAIFAFLPIFIVTP